MRRPQRRQLRYAGVEIVGGGEVLRGCGGAGGRLHRLLHVQLLDDLLGFHGLVGGVRAGGGWGTAALVKFTATLPELRARGDGGAASAYRF